MPVLKQEELTKVLDVLFEALLNKGMLPKEVAADKEAIIEKIVTNFNENNIEITKENVLDPKYQKGLCLIIIDELVGSKHPELKFDFIKLFEEKNPNDTKNELTNELERIFNAMKNLKPGPKFNCKKEAEEATENLTLQPFQKLIENERVLNMLIELEAANMALFGFPSKEMKIVPTLSMITTNMKGVALTEISADRSILGNQERAMDQDLGQPGDKSTTIMNDLLKGLDNILEKAHVKGIHPTPLNTTPHRGD